MSEKTFIPTIEIVAFGEDGGDIGNDFLITPATAGNYIQKMARQSPLLNEKIRVQVVARDAKAADILAYEFKKAGVEVIGVAQSGAKIVMEVTALLSSILMTAWLYSNLINNIQTTNKNAMPAFKETVKKFAEHIPGGIKTLKWAGALGIVGALGKYVADRVSFHNNRNTANTRFEPKYSTPAF